MDAETILIRTLKYLETEKFVSKNDALYTGERSTADIISSSFESIPETTEDDILKYSPTVSHIIHWVTRERSSSDYMMSCYNALETAKTAPEKVYGLLTSLVNSFKKTEDMSYDTSAVTIPNDFLADPGAKVDTYCKVLKINSFKDFKKMMMVSDSGHLVTYCENHDKSKKSDISTGDRVHVKGTVLRNKFTTPFETTLTRATVKKMLAGF